MSLAKTGRDSVPKNEKTLGKIDIDTHFNPFFVESKEFEVALIGIFAKLPLTGCIMNAVFKSKDKVPTSSATEANIRIVKRNLFVHQKRIRADRWHETHLNFLKGRLEMSDIPEQKSDVEIETDEHEDDLKIDYDNDHEGDEKQESDYDDIDSDELEFEVLPKKRLYDKNDGKLRRTKAFEFS